MAVKKETVATTDTNTEVKETKPKTTKTTTTKSTKTGTVDTNAELLKSLMAQMEAMKAELDSAKQEKNSMSELVDALKSSTVTEKRDLPQRVKVISLVDNTLILSTQPNGGGTVFTFPKFGHTMTIKTSQLEDILSTPAYRAQAEEPLFYICDTRIVEDQQLSDVYENIDKDRIEYIKTLSEDMCVDLFCGLGERLKESISSYFVENIAKNNVSYDRNRLGMILDRTGVDIEAKARDMRKTLDVIEKRTQV